MENNENLVVEATEKVENPTEQPPKIYTEAEFNARLDDIVGKRLARKEAKIRKEYEQRYGELESVLRAGTGKSDVTEMTSTFKEFYKNKGIEIPERKAEYSKRECEILGGADADEIINAGYDEVVEEVDRLAAKGIENMSAREKETFKKLAEYRQSSERTRELSSIGATEDVYNSQDFKDFASKFNAKTPIKDIYDIYNKTQPKKEIQTMGSLKNSTSDDSSIKDFYTYEEASRFTRKDLDKNPALAKAIESSMTKWK